MTVGIDRRSCVGSNSASSPRPRSSTSATETESSSCSRTLWTSLSLPASKRPRGSARLRPSWPAGDERLTPLDETVTFERLVF